RQRGERSGVAPAAQRAHQPALHRGEENRDDRRPEHRTVERQQDPEERDRDRDDEQPERAVLDLRERLGVGLETRRAHRRAASPRSGAAPSPAACRTAPIPTAASSGSRASQPACLCESFIAPPCAAGSERHAITRAGPHLLASCKWIYSITLWVVRCTHHPESRRRAETDGDMSNASFPHGDSSCAAPRYRSLTFGVTRVAIDERADGSRILRAEQPLGAYPQRLTDRLLEAARNFPDRVFLARRRRIGDARTGDWETLTYGDALARARSIARSLIDRELDAERPVAIL